MPLTKSERAQISKAKSVGTSDLAVPLDNNAACYLAWMVVQDLGYSEHFAEFPGHLPPLYSEEALGPPRSSGRLFPDALYGARGRNRYSCVHPIDVGVVDC